MYAYVLYRHVYGVEMSNKDKEMDLIPLKKVGVFAASTVATAAFPFRIRVMQPFLLSRGRSIGGLGRGGRGGRGCSWVRGPFGPPVLWPQKAKFMRSLKIEGGVILYNLCTP